MLLIDNGNMKTMTPIKVILKSLILSLLLLPLYVSAQEGEVKNDYQKSFDEFNTSINKEFTDFKSKNDSVFYNFLEQSWLEFQLFRDKRQSIPKPVDQPISKPVKIKNNTISPIERKTMLQDSGKQLILNGKPASYQTKAVVNMPDIPTTTVDFYGLKIDIPEQAQTAPEYTVISNSDIALYFKNACNNDYLSITIELLQDMAIDGSLNGWGYIELLREASVNLYNDTNHQVLFTWYALLKSGYDARVAYSNTNIFLLATFDVPIFYNSYFISNNKKYFIIPFNSQKGDMELVRSYEGEYPSELSSLSLYFQKLPSFTNISAYREVQYHDDTITLAYNSNLKDYYGSYPECDLSVYFPPPLSNIAISSLSEYIVPKLKNKTEVEKVNFLLDFIQYAIDYKTDVEQFGTENYLFAEESIFYPYADCEDRAVLLAQLVKHFLGLKTIAIIYPSHVSLGVNITEAIDGTSVVYDNHSYYIADPTYIGAKIGMVMPEYENTPPEVIEF